MSGSVDPPPFTRVFERYPEVEEEEVVGEVVEVEKEFVVKVTADQDCAGC